MEWPCVLRDNQLICKAKLVEINNVDFRSYFNSSPLLSCCI